MKKRVNLRKVATWLVAMMMMIVLSLMFWYSIIESMPTP